MATNVPVEQREFGRVKVEQAQHDQGLTQLLSQLLHRRPDCEPAQLASPHFCLISWYPRRILATVSAYESRLETEHGQVAHNFLSATSQLLLHLV